MVETTRRRSSYVPAGLNLYSPAVSRGDRVPLALHARPQVVRDEADVGVVAEDAIVRVHQSHHDVRVARFDEALHQPRGGLRAVGLRVAVQVES